MPITILSNSVELTTQFAKACKNYDSLQVGIAWVGNPRAIPIFEHLHHLKSVHAVIGSSFDQSHPDGIEVFMGLDKNLRIAKDNPLFHPKVYIFKKGTKMAMLLGSSNFTVGGFAENIESNLFLEGKEFDNLIREQEKKIRFWASDDFSFPANQFWLEKYRRRYLNRQLKLKKAGIKNDGAVQEEGYGKLSWLVTADWAAFVKQLKNSREFPKRLESRIADLNLYRVELKLPWTLSYFNELEKRKMIWGEDKGKRRYWNFGNAGAYGHFKGIIKNGTLSNKRKIIQAINLICNQDQLPNREILEPLMDSLVNDVTSPQGKVASIICWSRLLAITRPDWFCSIMNNTLRDNIYTTTKIKVDSVSAYLSLLDKIHNSPWFKSSPPKDKFEQRIWRNRVALLDCIFYE